MQLHQQPDRFALPRTLWTQMAGETGGDLGDRSVAIHQPEHGIGRGGNAEVAAGLACVTGSASAVTTPPEPARVPPAAGDALAETFTMPFAVIAIKAALNLSRAPTLAVTVEIIDDRITGMRVGGLAEWDRVARIAPPLV
jgi:hypothetical protein